MLLAVSSLAPAVAEDGRAQPILHDFVPEVERLEQISGDMLKTRYSDRTIAGIYDITRHSDQRYVETLSAEGRVEYRERAFAAVGKWFVSQDNLCFTYDDQPGREHCFTLFHYGDCVVSYSNDEPIYGGRPVVPAAWSSVQKFVDEDFRWPDVPVSEADEFTCFLSIV